MPQAVLAQLHDITLVIKGIIYPRMKILLSNTCIHVDPNLYDLLKNILR